MRLSRRVVLIALMLTSAVAQAQPTPRIAWVWPGSASGEAVRSSAFKQGMRDIGMVEGQHYVLDERYADGQYERFPALTEEVLALKPAILMVVTIESVRVAQQATKTVPIVFVATNDPVGIGLIASYARPGGNSTGLSSQNEDTAVKNVQLLHELLPRAKRFAALVNPGNPSGAKIFEQMRGAARGLGIAAVAVDVSSPQGLDAALGAILQQRPDALLVLPDSMLFSERERIAAFTLKNRLPHIAPSQDHVAAGALMSYGAQQFALFRRSAIYVKKILAGAKPAELPVEQPTTFELVINLKTAKAIGITIPRSLLLRADEVIE